jgi:MFS superfamily sulfate permease-like transporter
LISDFFCSSRHTVVTVISALSLLVGASVVEFSGGDPVRHAALAAWVPLVVAAIAFARGWCAPGDAVGFFSEMVLVGLKAASRSTLRARSFPSCSASNGGMETSERTARISSRFIAHLGETHPIPLLVGIALLTGLVAGKLRMKNRPVACSR